MPENIVGQPDFFSAQIAEAKRFYLDLQPSRHKELTVVSGGWEHCAPDYHNRRSDFPYLCIEYVAQGEGTLVLRRRSYKLTAGTVFTYGPGVAHDIRTDPSRCLRKYFIDFVGWRAERLLRENELPPGTVTLVSVPTHIRENLDNLIGVGLATTRHARRRCASLLEYLLLAIADHAVPYGAQNSAAFSTFLRCRQLIEEQFLSLRTVEDAAANAHVDTAYLCRLFRRYDHQSPYQFLLRLKMNRAADLLQKPGRLIKQVAEELGYTDPYTFSRAFKVVHGVSPKRFLELGAR